MEIFTTDIIKGKHGYILPNNVVSIKEVSVNGVKVKNKIIVNILVLSDPLETDIKDGLKIECEVKT